MDSTASKVSDNEEISESDIDKHFDLTELPSDVDDVDNKQLLNKQNPRFIHDSDIVQDKDDKPDVKLIDEQCELMNKNDKEVLLETDVHKEELEISGNSSDLPIFFTNTQIASDGCVQVASFKDDDDSESDADVVQACSDMDELERDSENGEQDILLEKKELPKRDSYTDPLEKFASPSRERKMVASGQGISPLRGSILDVLQGLPIIPRVFSVRFHLDINETEPIAVVQNIESCVGRNTILNIQARFPDEFCCSTLCEITYQNLCKQGFTLKDQNIKVHPTVANVRGLRMSAPSFIGENVIRRKLNKKFGHIISMKCFRSDAETNIWILIIVIMKPIPEELSFSNTTIAIEVGDSTF